MMMSLWHACMIMGSFIAYIQVLTELNSLKCAHEALKTQHVMDKEERGKKIKELTSSLEQAEHTRLKQEKCMNELKSKLADMVSTSESEGIVEVMRPCVNMMIIWVMVV